MASIANNMNSALSVKSSDKKGIKEFLLLRMPLLLLGFWILFKAFIPYFVVSSEILPHVSNIVLIWIAGWILIATVRILFYYLERKLGINLPDSYNARMDLTKMEVWEGIIIVLLVSAVISICFIALDGVRAIGTGMFTLTVSAGIAIGIAARKSMAAIAARLRIAFTKSLQPSDIVIVKGKLGSVEEITLTNIIVKLRDERRLILPINYFQRNTPLYWDRSI